MAISKDQPIRPYVQALGDDLVTSLDLIEQSLIDTINPFIGRFRFGTTDEVTIEAGINYSEPIIYNVPFAESAKYILLIDFTNAITPTNLSITINDKSYSGFRYTVHNAGEQDVTVRLGYMGMRVD